MTRIIDLKTYWTTKGDFDKNKCLTGSLILYPNGWFEGIGTTSDGDYSGDRYLYGVCEPDKYIRIYQVSPANIAYLTSYTGGYDRDCNVYTGSYDKIDRSYMHYCIGYSYSEVDERKLDIDELSSIIDNISIRIQQFKSEHMDDMNEHYYKAVVGQMEGIKAGLIADVEKYENNKNEDKGSIKVRKNEEDYSDLPF